jgi:hypothetical protein
VTGVRIVGHHPDYSLPLHIEWLCTPCHSAVHLNGDQDVN